MLAVSRCPELADLYCHALNRQVYGVELSQHKSADERRVFVWLACDGKHLTHRSIKSITDDARAGREVLRCPYCSQATARTRAASTGEREVQRQLEWAGLPHAVEVCVVNGWPAPADFWLYEHNMAVQFDGEQHVGKGIFDRTAAEQQERDADFNALCWRQGLRVVRIHYDDLSIAWKSIAKGARLALRFPQCRFVVFSPSVGKPNMVQTGVRCPLDPPPDLEPHAFIQCIRHTFNC